jgi:adenylate cyclase, class 2
MGIEIEAKMKVDDHATVRASLDECAAERVGEFLETNTFFDTEDRSLLTADQGLRLRRLHNLQTNEESYVLTFKGPRKHGQLKSRDETELAVNSGHDAADLLQCLGYSRVLTFEKKRQSWKLEGCQVELDELPYLGSYVEIEGPTEQMVLGVRDKLGLSTRPLIKASYIAMLMTHLQERARTERVVTFTSAAADKSPPPTRPRR